MERDIRKTSLYLEIEREAVKAVQPGSGSIVAANDFHASPDGRTAVFSATLYDKLLGLSASKLCTVDLQSGDRQLRTHGSGSDRSARWSPDGGTIAFTSDRDAPGNFQLHLLDTRSWISRRGPIVDGFVESIEWSANGTSILLLVAGGEADLAGAQGGINAALIKADLPDWTPDIDAGPRDNQWRRLWLLDIAAETARVVSPLGLNVWEACWCGPDAAAAIASGAPDEADWYRASVQRIPLAGGEVRTLYTPKHHLGWVAASTSGDRVAVVEAICSDRTIVAGDIVWLADDQAPRRLPAAGVDVNHVRFLGEDALMFAGHRSFETVLGKVDAIDETTRILWVANDRTFGGARYPEIALLPGERVIASVEGFLHQPTISILGADNATNCLCAVGNPIIAQDLDDTVGAVEALRWNAPDGLEIHGWLLTPKASVGPTPMVMDIHGGPVWQWRQMWLGGSLARRMLLARGYSILLPNPRGSSGRGQEFAAKVFGDMGGADTHDCLSAIDYLVARGSVDAKNLFVTGGSYGGFMSSWLISQDNRFAAAVPVAPVTDWYSEHLVSHIPHFCRIFLDDDISNPGGKYFSRSPAFHVKSVKTPTLVIAGALDRNTPAGQAVEFHHALREQGVTSVLALYPKEGHGVRTYPAVIDFTARMLGWFEQYRRRSE